MFCLHGGERRIRTFEGFSRQIYSLIPLTAWVSPPGWSWQWDSNPQPADYKSAALPIELCQQKANAEYNFYFEFCQSFEGIERILLPVSGHLEDRIGSDLRVGKRNLNRMIGAELIIPKDMFSSQQLVGPVFKKAGGIFQTVDIMATGPDLEISKVGAEAYFVRNTDFFRSIFSFPKKCIDIGTLSVFVENVTKSFAIGPYSTADSRRISQHPHWITLSLIHI